MPVLGRAARKGLTLVLSGRPRSLFASDQPTTAGVRVGPESSMQAVAVYAATRLIAQTIMSLPIRFLERGDKTRTPLQPREVRAFWDEPNPDQDLPSFIESIMLSLLLWGNIYIFPRRNAAGDVLEMWPLDPERITAIERIVDEEMQVGLRFQVMGLDDPDHPGGWVFNLPGRPPDMLHIPLMTLPGRIKGLSPVAQAAVAIGMTLSAQEHSTRFLGDGVHISGMIEVPNDMEEEDAKDLWDNVQRVHAGPKKGGRFGILTGGAKFNTITIPPLELQFLEQQKYGDRKIGTLYGVPPHMVGDVERSTSWGTGIEEQTKGFLQYTLVPLLLKIEKSVEKAFLGGTDIRMKFITNGLLRGSSKDRSEFYVRMRNAGVFSANDIRELEDLSPIEDGDIYLQPLNMIDVGATDTDDDGEPVTPIKERVDSAAALVRAGYDPADALEAVGLDPMLHVGLLPVTLQAPQDEPPATDGSGDADEDN